MEWPARLPPVGGGGVSVSLSKAFLSKKNGFWWRNLVLTFFCLAFEGKDALYTNLASSDLKSNLIMTIMSLFYQI